MSVPNSSSFSSSSYEQHQNKHNSQLFPQYHYNHSNKKATTFCSNSNTLNIPTSASAVFKISADPSSFSSSSGILTTPSATPTAQTLLLASSVFQPAQSPTPSSGVGVASSHSHGFPSVASHLTNASHCSSLTSSVNPFVNNNHTIPTTNTDSHLQKPTHHSSIQNNSNVYSVNSNYNHQQSQLLQQPTYTISTFNHPNPQSLQVDKQISLTNSTIPTSSITSNTTNNLTAITSPQTSTTQMYSSSPQSLINNPTAFQFSNNNSSSVSTLPVDIQMTQLFRGSSKTTTTTTATTTTTTTTNYNNNSDSLQKLDQLEQSSNDFNNNNNTNNNPTATLTNQFNFSNENLSNLSENIFNNSKDQQQYPKSQSIQYTEQQQQYSPATYEKNNNILASSTFISKTPSHNTTLNPSKSSNQPQNSQHSQHPLVQAFQMSQKDKLSNSPSSSSTFTHSPSKRHAYEPAITHNTIPYNSQTPHHQLVQNFAAQYSNNNLRQASPSTTTLKSSVNNGTANNNTIASPFKPSNIISTRGQQLPVTTTTNPTTSQQQDKQTNSTTINRSKIQNSRTEMSTSPEGKLHMRINSPMSTLAANQGQSSQQQSYYKVAQQIRRNESKDRRLSVASGVAQSNIGISAVSGRYINEMSSIGSNQLTQSQNNGRADGSNPRQDSANSRNLLTKSIHKDNSKSKDHARQKLNNVPENTTNTNKMNEKYTKKMIIDLCNYMNNSNDENASNNNNQKQQQQSSASSIHDRSRWSAKSNNMNMLDILSQQRVLQRSISSSKRGTIKPFEKPNISYSKNHSNNNALNSNNTTNPSLLPGSSSSGSQSLAQSQQFQQFTGQRSINSSASRINWNLNGSQNLSESISSIKIDIKNRKLLSTEAIGLSSIVTSTQTMKEDIQGNKGTIGVSGGVLSRTTIGAPATGKTSQNTLILSCFNDSQEVHSSRNLVIPSNRKRENSNGEKGQKYKFTNSNSSSNAGTTHLSKPQTSSNAFAKFRQSPGSNNIAHKSSEYLEINPEYIQQQPFSPEPTSCQNSKNSTKSEIKKSQIFSGSSSNINGQSSDKKEEENHTHNNFSRQESFDKDDAGMQEDQRSRELVHGHYEEYDEENDLEAEEADQDDGEEEEHEGDNEEHKINESRTSSSNKTESASIRSDHREDQLLNLVPSTKQHNYQAYNYEIELEHLQGIHLNMDEYRKERSKLIRKISQTFKIKNKALSTSQEYYKMLHVIGKGAFAKVCLAIQLLTGKLVAIKMIDKNILRSDSAKKRVLQEVQILKKLSNHKHVLRLLEVFENRKLIFIVTEYFQGSDLMKIMKERNGEPFPEDAVKAMLAQILSGLQYIHGNMVLHRDIKLDNMLIDEKGALKIIDFGISRMIAPGQRMTEQCGTPAFLAPEIILNKGYEGFASDYWSLGVLLYILLFGKVPFKGNNLVELHRSIVSGVLSVDEMADSKVSKDGQWVLTRLLNTKVKERAGMQEILSSNWMRGVQIPDGKDNSSKNGLDILFDNNTNMTQSVATSNKAFDEVVIAHIESFGYSREYILRCLNKVSLSHVNAIYQLLKGK